MRLFDLHCDTVEECFENRLPLKDADLHINLCKGECLDEWCQCFAIWIFDKLRGKESEEYFEEAVAYFKNQIELNSEKIKLCKDYSDLTSALSEKKCAAVLTVEGGSPFASDGGGERAYEHGVKLITLTWNGENELGYGCQSGKADGLKPAGKRLLREMESFGIAADVSHLNRRGFFDAVSSGARVIASHSTCKTVLEKLRSDSDDKIYCCRRALEDDQIKILIEREGLIGMNFCQRFLGDPERGGFESVYRHMVHILELGGENVLAIGSDFDGCAIHPELAGVDKVPALREYLSDKGFDETLLDKIFFKNSFDFFKKVLQN